MIESQRRLAELGLFRRVRITELPRTGSLTRDVLVDLEEAPTTTIDYGGGLEVGRIARRRRRRPGRRALDVAPRGFFEISRRNLWGKNRSVTLFAPRHAASARAGGSTTDPAGHRRRLRLQRLSRVVHVPRAARVRHDRRRPVHRLHRAGHAHELLVQPQGRHAPTTPAASAAITVTGRYTFDYTKVFDERISPEDQLLIDRLFPQVRLSKVFGAVLRDSRDDVLDPQRGAVIGRRHLGRGASARLRSGVREELRPGLHLSPPAGPRRGGGRRRASRRWPSASRRVVPVPNSPRSERGRPSPATALARAAIAPSCFPR